MKLSILIPARNEEFIGKTIENLLENIEGETEIIAVLDGYDIPIPDIPRDDRVTIVNLPRSIGQRAATNLAAKMSNAKYVAKTDAHCSFDKGFDVKLMADMQDDWTLVPVMRNLHGFDWVCKNGHRRYQSPSGVCTKCGEPTEKDIKWIGKTNPQSTAYRFDKTMHFQYWQELKKRQVGDLVETLSLQGSFFMMTRDKYWELDICDEKFGSWGQQGVEVACKTWLSGGRVIVSKETWYAHMFRTQGGDFGFPYKQSGKQVEKAREYSRDLFINNKWEKAIHSFQWLINKFEPPEWEVKPTRGVLYYSNNMLNMKIARECRKQISASGLPITSVTLKPTNFGRNIVYKGESSYKTMFKQILVGLEAMEEDVVYFAEHDVLYHPDHFNFIPTEDKFYYNGNYWFVRPDGFAIHYDVSPLSGLVVKRDIAIKHFKERIALIEKQGFGYYMGFEPFTHKRIKWKTWYDFEVFMPEYPNIDISHEANMTNKRWTQDKFRKKPKFWEEGNVDSIKGWNNLRSLINANRL